MCPGVSAIELSLEGEELKGIKVQQRYRVKKRSTLAGQEEKLEKLEMPPLPG